MNSTEAQQTPDPNTGTHADQNENGFWSNDNDNAKVTFVANGSDGSEPFPKPVIQVQEVPTGNLTITKQVTGIDSGDLNLINGQKFTFNIKKLTSENGDTDTGFTDEELGFVNGVKQIAITGAGATTVEGLPEGYYCVEEVTDGLTAVGDYEYIGNSVSVDSVTIVSNTTVSVTVTNTYAHRDKTLTITKKVEGNMGDRDHDFEFEITVLNGNDTLLENDVYREIAGTAQKSGTALDNLTFNTEGKATFTLQNDQIFIITIPHGCQYIVEEVNNEGYNVTVEVNSGNGSYNSESGQLKGTLTADTSATFTNDRTVNPPTGLIHTSAPFAAMIIIALGAVVIFITGRRIRR